MGNSNDREVFMRSSFVVLALTIFTFVPLAFSGEGNIEFKIELGYLSWASVKCFDSDGEKTSGWKTVHAGRGYNCPRY